MVFGAIILSTFLVSLVSLIGVFSLTVKEKLLQRLSFCLIGFSAGALIGSAFLHLLPEALEKTKSTIVFYYLLLGIVIFFLLEKYLHWRHCHEDNCHIHPFTYLNLIGDGLHNFLDGMVIAASFVISFKLGVVTTVAIILHEIPQELSDFAVLIYGGFSRRKALVCNFLIALTAMIGAIVGYLLADFSRGFLDLILPLTAGGFIYISSSDLIPELHRQGNRSYSNLSFIAFLLGIVFMGLAKRFLPG